MHKEEVEDVGSLSLISLWRLLKQVLYKKSIQRTVPIMGRLEGATESVVEEVRVSEKAFEKKEFRSLCLISLWRLLNQDLY